MRLIMLAFGLAGCSFWAIAQDPLNDAMQAFSSQELLRAEGQLLAFKGYEGELPRVGHYLAAIAVEVGPLDAKRRFYGSQLAVDRHARGSALYVLAALAAHQRDWSKFSEHARLFLNEYPADRHGFRYHQVYYLARYTSTRASDLSLKPNERKWFNACRELGPDQNFPEDVADIVFPFNALYLLEGSRLFDLPEYQPPLFEAQYVYQLLQVKRELLSGDLAAAVDLVNAFRGAPWIGVRFDQRILLDGVMQEIFEALGETQRAEKNQARYKANLSRAVLPLVAWPEERVHDAQLTDISGEIVTESANLPDSQATAEMVSEPIADAMTLLDQVDAVNLEETTAASTEAVEDETAVAPSTASEATLLSQVEALNAQEVATQPLEQPAEEAVGSTEPEAIELVVESSQPEPETGEVSLIDQVENVNRSQSETIDQATVTDAEPADDLGEEMDPLFSDPLPTIDVVSTAALDEADPVPNASLETGPPVDSEPATGKSASLTLEEIERELKERGGNGFLAAMQGKRLNTEYKRIYAEYLNGLYQLREGKLQSASDHLDRAREDVTFYPFPLLETKVLLAMGRLYEVERNLEQAEWYRIAAAQIINEPSSVAFLNRTDPADRPQPHREAIDSYLNRVTREDLVHQLVYASELAHYSDVRLNAYQRHVLSANKVIGNQIEQIGNDLATLVGNMAELPNRSVSPQQYNQTLELFEQLWQKTLPYYREYRSPGVGDLQDRLGDRGRCVSFIEGERLLGVLIISSRQQFAIALGPKSSFLAMNPHERIAFLESRIGPVWDYNGPLWMALSPAYRDPEFIATLYDNVLNPDQLRWIFSLSQLLYEEPSSNCSGTAVFSQSAEGEMNDYVQQFPRVGLNWYAQPATFERQVRRQVASHPHLVFESNVLLREGGMVLVMDEREWEMTELVDLSQGICSITLISPEARDWPLWIETMELIEAGQPVRWLISSGIPNVVLADEPRVEAYLSVNLDE